MNSFLQRLTKTLQKEKVSQAEGADNYTTETLLLSVFPKYVVISLRIGGPVYKVTEISFLFAE